MNKATAEGVISPGSLTDEQIAFLRKVRDDAPVNAEQFAMAGDLTDRGLVKVNLPHRRVTITEAGLCVLNANDFASGRFIVKGAQEFRPSLSYRLRRALGFRRPDVEPPEPSDEWPEHITTVVQVNVSWLDRLRLLISGALFVRVLTQTCVPVERARSLAASAVDFADGYP